MSDLRTLLVNFIRENEMSCFQTSKMSESKTIGLPSAKLAEARKIEKQIKALGVPNVWIGDQGIVFCSLKARNHKDIEEMSL